MIAASESVQVRPALRAARSDYYPQLARLLKDRGRAADV
jgi:hypothetical protein